MKAVRVAMLGWEFPPAVSGGLGVHCYELTKALSGYGAQIDFYMPKTASAPVSSGPGVRVVPVDFDSFSSSEKFLLPGPYPQSAWRTVTAVSAGLSAKPLGENYGTGFFEAVSKYNALAARLVQINHSKRNYEVIHYHDWIAAQAGLSACSLTGLPGVSTIHSTEFDRTANLSPLDWIAGIERSAVAKSDAVITVSHMMRCQLVERFGADPSRLFVIYNGVDPSLFSGRPKAKPRQLGKKVVLFHGRLSIQKGPDFFLKAAKRVLEAEPQAHFIVSGKGGMLAQLVGEAISLGIIDHVTFTGFVAESELASLYASADVYVLPSVSEPFGISVLEAMSSGVPVIVSKTAGVGERLRNCLKVDFWDVDEMASNIVALLRYAPLSSMMSAGSCSEAREFSWPLAAHETMQVYNRAISSKTQKTSGR
ncbi:MAG: glycosyltransferase family 4 protein [Candidatus Micrarchaeota archaeon]